MEKITYLFGAGASFGERGENQKEITRGVPIISEFENVINQVIQKIHATNNDANTPQSPSFEIINELRWLTEKCESYPTIDTYAKMLYLTKKSSEYNRLKRIISVFFMLEQYYFKHDLRYDGFIASLLDENNNFPPIDILTWNYDAQFEISYSDYSNNGKYISNLWSNLNVMNKTVATKENDKNQFSIIKLNGTALFIDQDGDAIVDILNGGYKEDKVIPKVNELLAHSLFKNTLSYSWDRNDYFINKVAERTKDTTSLIVIGYSFPYVNRKIDRKIIQSMNNLKKIYIQDPFAEELKENIQAVLHENINTVEIITKKNTKQLFIPSEL